MIVTTCNEVPGRTIAKYVGIVRGIVVRAPGVGQSLAAGFQQFVGGNIEAFGEVCDQARQEALTRMVAQASHMGANAILGMRYDATEFSAGVTEVLAYGTAVLLSGTEAEEEASVLEVVPAEEAAGKVLLQDSEG